MKLPRVAQAMAASAVLFITMGQGVGLAQPPGAVLAGQYSMITRQAGFFAFDPASASGLDINVVDTIRNAALQGGPATSTEVVQLNVSAFGAGTNAFGCFDIAPTDFSLASGVASLHASITGGTATCSPPFGMQPPLTVDVVWNASSPVVQSGDVTEFGCGQYTLETQESRSGQSATATATVSPLLPATVTGQGGFGMFDQRQHANGVEPDNCQPFGASPGGAGPPPAGMYANSSVMVGFFIQNPGDFRPSLEVDVFGSSSQSTPKVGAPSSTDQLQVNIISTAGGNFQFGCFNLTSAQFTNNGVLGATLNTKFDSNSPPCFAGVQATVPLPLTVNIVWTGSGPVATTHGVSNLSCGTYRLQGDGLSMTNNENVKASLTPLLSGPVTATGTMQASSSLAHAEGSLGPPCPI